MSLQTFGENVVDLGTTLDLRMSFHSHIERVTCKALKIHGLIKRILLISNCSALVRELLLICTFSLTIWRSSTES